MKLSGIYFETSKEFNHSGDRIDILEDFSVYQNTSFRDISFILYGEYGITDRLTILGNLPFKILTTERTETNVSYFDNRNVSISSKGFSDLKLSGRFRLLSRPLITSLQAGIKLPLGYDETPSNNGATLGTGEIDGEAWLLLGKSMYPLPFYITGGVGYRSRGGAVHDEIAFSLETGITISKTVFKLTIDGVQNTSTPPDIYGQTVITPLPGGGGALPQILYGDQHFLKISPGIIQEVSPGYSIQAEIIHIAAGKNIISGSMFSIGIVKSR